MKGWTVGRKIGWTGGVLVLLTVVLGGSGILGLRSIATVERKLLSDAVPGIVACSKVEADLLEIRGDILRHIYAPDPSGKLAMDDRITTLRQRLQVDLQDVKSATGSAEERALNDKVNSTTATYLQQWDQTAVLSRQLKNAEAQQEYLAKADLFYAARDAVHAQTEYNRRLCIEYGSQAARTQRQITATMWVTLVVSVLISLTLLGAVVRGLNRRLRTAVSELTEGAGQVNAAAGQVASSSQAQAQGASEQAASLEESSAAAEEIRAMAQANADQSATATQLAHTMASQFLTVNGSLNELMSAMSGIGEASGQISKIIKVIDEISFQTNLLALNAAVEAARAGEAGMGFAVVADEVRNLAQRSAQAAKDTTDLIEGSIERSNTGRTKADRVAEEIRAIAKQVEQVKTIVEEINHSSAEQATGISQVARGIAEMERVTQGSAASAEEAAAAAEQLTAQAQSVRAVVRGIEVLVSGGSDAGAHRS